VGWSTLNSNTNLELNREDVIPSRHSNPFATCWTRPGALPFLFAEGLTAELLIARLAANRWRGQIIGPHGCGKSTLLATIAPLLRAAKRRIDVVDGFEELSRWRRWSKRLTCRWWNSGLLVTAHRSVGLPTLMELSPDQELVRRLVSQLCERTATGLSAADVDASSARHGSNVRETFFELYDRHEQLARARVNRRRQRA